MRLPDLSLSGGSRLLLSCTPIGVGLVIPAMLAFWVDLRRLKWSIPDATLSAVLDYYRPYGDSVILTTLYQMPPFILLSLIAAFLGKTCKSIVWIIVVGLIAILSIQIPLTIRMLKRIIEGEAEFVTGVYILISVESTMALGFAMWILWTLSDKGSGRITGGAGTPDF